MKWRGLLADTGIFRVFGDTDDLQPASLELEPLAERIAALPVALRHGLVDHGDERDFFVIGAGEFAAGDERNAQGDEIAGADFVVVDGGRFLQRRRVAIDDDGRGGRADVAERYHS